MPHRIYQFSQESGEGEFLVISKDLPADILKEFQVDGAQLDRIYTIKDSGTYLPTERRLVPVLP